MGHDFQIQVVYIGAGSAGASSVGDDVPSTSGEGVVKIFADG
jgi:hypothetical protein